MIVNGTINIGFETQTEEEILNNISIFLTANKNVILEITKLSEGNRLNNCILQKDIKEIRTLVLCTLGYLYDFKTKHQDVENMILKIEDIRSKVKIILNNE